MKHDWSDFVYILSRLRFYPDYLHVIHCRKIVLGFSVTCLFQPSLNKFILFPSSYLFRITDGNPSVDSVTDGFPLTHDDVIKWKHFPRNWPFVREIHRSPVNFPHKGQWRGALMFSLNYAWINDWVNNREAGDLRRQHGHYDVIVMKGSWCRKRFPVLTSSWSIYLYSRASKRFTVFVGFALYRGTYFRFAICNISNISCQDIQYQKKNLP